MNTRRVSLEVLRKRAQHMRRNPTRAERAFWEMVRYRSFHGLRFRRQVVLFPYIADFVSREARLIVEVDGPIHSDKARDEQRRGYLERTHGLVMLRFSNERVMEEPWVVWSVMEKAAGVGAG